MEATMSFQRKFKRLVETEFAGRGYKKLRTEEYLVFESEDAVGFAVLHFSKSDARPCTELQYCVSSNRLLALSGFQHLAESRDYPCYVRWRGPQLLDDYKGDLLPYPIDQVSYDELASVLPTIIERGDAEVRRFRTAAQILDYLAIHPETSMISTKMHKYLQGRVAGVIEELTFRQWRESNP